MPRSPLAVDLRRAAAGEGLPSTPAAVREHVERLMTDAAAAALVLERRALRGDDALQAQIDELRAFTAVLRRRFAVQHDA